MDNKQIEDEARKYVNNHVQNPEYFEILPDTSPKNLNAYCERCYIAGSNARKEDIEKLRNGIQWALDNPQSVFLFDELKKLIK